MAQGKNTRVATVPGGRGYRISSLIENTTVSSMTGSATKAGRLIGLYVNKLSHLKLEKAIQCMKGQRPLTTCLMETLQVTTRARKGSLVATLVIERDYGEASQAQLLGLPMHDGKTPSGTRRVLRASRRRKRCTATVASQTSSSTAVAPSAPRGPSYTPARSPTTTTS